MEVREDPPVEEIKEQQMRNFSASSGSNDSISMDIDESFNILLTQPATDIQVPKDLERKFIPIDQDPSE